MEKAASASASAVARPSFVATARSTAFSLSERPSARTFRSRALVASSSVLRYVTISASLRSDTLVAVESMAVRTAAATARSSLPSAARNCARMAVLSESACVVDSRFPCAVAGRDRARVVALGHLRRHVAPGQGLRIDPRPPRRNGARRKVAVPSRAFTAAASWSKASASATLPAAKRSLSFWATVAVVPCENVPVQVTSISGWFPAARAVGVAASVPCATRA